MYNIKNVISRIRELRMHKFYEGEESPNGVFRAKAFAEAQDYGDILNTLKIIDEKTDVNLYKVQKSISLLRLFIDKEERSLRVSDEIYRPVIEGDLFVLRQALDIFETVQKNPVKKG